MSQTIEQAPRRTTEGNNVTVTPTVRRTARRLAYWVAALAAIAIVGTISVFAAGSAGDGLRLSANNAGSAGSKALIQVLRQNGVTVTASTTLADALRDARRSDDTTIAIYDPSLILNDDQITRLGELGRPLVLIEPSFSSLEILAPTVAQAGAAQTVQHADCSYRPVRSAGTVVSADAIGYHASSSDLSAVSCLGSGHGIHSLIRTSSATTTETVTVFGDSSALTNGAIARQGNAALGLGMLGNTSHLVWYLPSAADLEGTGDINVPWPNWLVPTIGLGLLLVIAAAFWRGRRFGPLVIEPLPVVVRASETMEGRARLYQKSSSRTHALDSLRIGAIGRIAVLCGLSRQATVTEVIGAASVATGRSADAIRTLLLDDLPSGDSSLLRLSDALTALERDVATATRPS